MAPTTWDQLGASHDRVASKYEDRFLDELAGKPRDRELLDAFAMSVGDPVLDIGCGPGQIGAYVRRRGRIVVGSDISTAMVKQAAQRLDGAIAADLRKLPLGDGTVAGVLAFYGISTNLYERLPEWLGVISVLDMREERDGSEHHLLEDRHRDLSAAVGLLRGTRHLGPAPRLLGAGRFNNLV